jgi:hypothetical protein
MMVMVGKWWKIMYLWKKLHLNPPLTFRPCCHTMSAIILQRCKEV